MPSISTLDIRSRPGDPCKGWIRSSSLLLPCALGKNGTTLIKREGDGATPLIVTRPLYGFYRNDREAKPQSPLPFHPLSPDMGWCDDVNQPSYNRQVKLPFVPSHETMWRDDALYDLVVVLDINIKPRKKGCGSALFMHVARDGFKPTQGCMALTKNDLRRLLKGLTPQTRIRILS